MENQREGPLGNLTESSSEGRDFGDSLNTNGEDTEDLKTGRKMKHSADAGSIHREINQKEELDGKQTKEVNQAKTVTEEMRPPTSVEEEWVQGYSISWTNRRFPAPEIAPF